MGPASSDDSAVLLAGSLDTKGEEIGFLRDCLRAAGLTVEVVDFGILGAPTITPDVTRGEIAGAAGDRGRAVAAMHRGLAAWVRARRERKMPAGMLSIGGSAGTAVATAGMRELPIGVPKLMVSTMASGDVRPYVGTSDI